MEYLTNPFLWLVVFLLSGGYILYERKRRAETVQAQFVESIAEVVNSADQESITAAFKEAIIEAFYALDSQIPRGWIKINDNQTANWANISNTSGVVWTQQNDTQTPNWQQINDFQG